MHDVLDAMYIYKNNTDESYLRKIIQPLENFVVHYPKIIIKDSCINSICYGAKLLIPGVLRFSNNLK